MRFLILASALVALLLGACSQQESEEAIPPLAERPAGGGLYAYGALDGMILEGLVEERVKLDALLPDENLYAVGALSFLRGEVTIIAGRAYISYSTEDGNVRTVAEAPPGEGAALLVTAKVEEWRELTTEVDIPFANLEVELNRLAGLAGLPPHQAFAFLVEGEVKNLLWHIIDGKHLQGVGGHSHEDYLAAAHRGELRSGLATLIGVYSDHHRGVFTHAGRNAHLHCVIAEPLLAAHVDQVDLPAGSTIRFSLP